MQARFVKILRYYVTKFAFNLRLVFWGAHFSDKSIKFRLLFAESLIFTYSVKCTVIMYFWVVTYPRVNNYSSWFLIGIHEYPKMGSNCLQYKRSILRHLIMRGKESCYIRRPSIWSWQDLIETGVMKSAVVVLVLLVAHGFADLAPDDQINKGLIQSVLKNS